MVIGKVVGSVVATRKNDNLVGSKFMIIESGNKMEGATRFVATDCIGAGIGDLVLVAKGSAARVGCNMPNVPIDAAIVGIIDGGIGLE